MYTLKRTKKNVVAQKVSDIYQKIHTIYRFLKFFIDLMPEQDICRYIPELILRQPREYPEPQ